MTDPARPPVQPYPDDDPVSYPELGPLGLTLRALMAVLADTGAAVVLPWEVPPVDAHIAAGWRLAPQFTSQPGTRDVILTCSWKPWPPQWAGVGE